MRGSVSAITMQQHSMRELDESIENLFLSVLQYGGSPTHTDVYCYNSMGKDEKLCAFVYDLAKKQQQSCSSCVHGLEVHGYMTSS